MARDLTKLRPQEQKTYNQLLSIVGEAEADKFYDREMKLMSPDTAPLAAQMVRPNTSQLQARLGVGEFEKPATLQDVFLEEEKALQAQTQAAADRGVPRKRDVELQIATELTGQGLQPIGPTAEEYRQRFQAELDKADYAEKEALKAVIPARGALTPGFQPKPPVVAATTIAKQPEQVEAMSGLEAIGAALRPQVLETPAETTARTAKEQQARYVDEQAAILSQRTGVSIDDARKTILGNVKSDIKTAVVQELGGGFSPEAEAETEKRYQAFLQENLPDDFIRVIVGKAQEGGAGAAAELAGAVAGRAGSDLLGFVATDKFDPQVYKDVKAKLGITPQTEAVVESLPMTLVRDVAGLSRFVLNPLLDAAFYDVDPETDKKIKPEEYGFLPRERTGEKEERAWGRSYIANSEGGIEDNLREIAVEIATARSLGDDLAAQQAVRPEDENYYRLGGAAAEVMLPMNLFSVPGKLGAFRAAEGLLGAVQANKALVKPFNEAVKRGGLLADELIKSPSLAKAMVEGSSVGAQIADKGADGIAVLKWYANNEPGAFNKLKTAGNAAVTNVLEELSPTLTKALNDPAVDSKVMATKILEDIAKSKSPVSSNAAKAALVPDAKLNTDAIGAPGSNIVAAGEIPEQLFVDRLKETRATAQQLLAEGLSDTTYGRWSFITPNIVMDQSKATKLLPKIVDEQKNIVESAVRVEVAPDGTAKFTSLIDGDLKEGSSLLNALKESIVPYTPQRAQSFREILQNVKPGAEITYKQYRAINDIGAELAATRVARANNVGAFSPARAGRAFRSALTPPELRAVIIDYGKQIGEDAARAAGNLTRRTFINAPTPKYIDTVASQYAGFLENFSTSFAQRVKDLARAGLTPEGIYGSLVAETYNFGPMGGRVKDAAEDIIKAQYNIDYSSARGKEIAKMIEAGLPDLIIRQGEGKFYDGINFLRNKIVERFPELRDTEAIPQLSRAPRIALKAGVADSLPETFLSVVFQEEKKRKLKELFDANRQAMYDDVVIRGFEKLDQELVLLRDVARLEAQRLGKKVPPEVSTAKAQELAINAINEGVVAVLNREDPIAAMKKALQKYEPNAARLDGIFGVIGDELVEAINAYAIDAYRRSPGWLAMDGGELLKRLDMQVTKLFKGGDEIALLPKNMREDAAFIQSALASARRKPIDAAVVNVASEVERQIPGFLLSLIADMSNYAGQTFSSLVEGMLAGRVLPNTSYLSDNTVTAPLIAAVTNPRYIDTVLKEVAPQLSKSLIAAVPGGGSYRRLGGYAEGLYDNARIAPNGVAFTTPRGQVITNEELVRLVEGARLGKPGLTAALDPKLIAGIRSLTETLGAGEVPSFVKSGARQFKDFIPGPTTSVPVTIATNADQSFRTELFIEALRRGANPEEAAAIGRETLLDYGLLNRVLPAQLQAVKKPFLFLTFTATMSLAILKALLRGETAANIGKMARFHRDLAKNSGIFAPGGQELESLWLEQNSTVGDKPANYAYVRDPIFGQLFWMSGLATNARNMIAGRDVAASGIETFEQVGFVPFMNFITDLATAKAGFVPARQIAMFQSPFAQIPGIPNWEQAQVLFNIEEVQPQKMKRGEPTFGGKQYRFRDEAGKQKFIAYQQALSLIGWNRTINDYFNALVAAGYAPEDAYLARYYPNNKQFEGVQEPAGGWMNGLLYMVARQRALRPPTQVEVYDRQIQTELRKLQSLQPRQAEGVQK